MSGRDCRQVTTTLDSRARAERLARELVEARLAACAQVSGPVTSIYHWQGVVERGEEWCCHFKTTPERLDALIEAIRSRHSYETPEIVVATLTATDDYGAWVHQTVNGQD